MDVGIDFSLKEYLYDIVVDIQKINKCSVIQILKLYFTALPINVKNRTIEKPTSSSNFSKYGLNSEDSSFGK